MNQIWNLHLNYDLIFRFRLIRVHKIIMLIHFIYFYIFRKKNLNKQKVKTTIAEILSNLFFGISFKSFVAELKKQCQKWVKFRNRNSFQKNVVENKMYKNLTLSP